MGKEAAPSPNDAIQTLRGALQQLEKRETHLQNKINSTLSSAKLKSKQNDKKGAIMELKKKKLLQQQCDSLQGKILNLEMQIMTLEDAIINQQTLKTMETGTKALSEINKDMNPDGVDDLIEDLTEQTELVNEVTQVLSEPIGALGMMDDDEFEDELAELDLLAAEELNPRVKVMEQVEVSNHKKVQEQKEEIMDEEEMDKELASLDAMMEPKEKKKVLLVQSAR